ncbi:MAG: adenylate/guanylate cyclase domain-containing protein [Rhodobacteraceae bacterium]|nr:adenylate/guanylate cyclase domain-containing protein [Paracoccaceae bacterium]
MAETALHIPRPRFLSDPKVDEANQDTEYAIAALEEHKREGLELAVKARWIAMGITGVFLVFLNPAWDVLYYHGILLLLCINGWLIRRVGRVGQSKAELFLIFLDLLIMTVGMVVPSPFSPHDVPAATQYRFDNFVYFYLILAVGTLAYSWRTVIAIGTWTAGMWSIALGLSWWFSVPFEGLSQAVAEAVGNEELLVKFIDPNSFVLQLRVQEVLVFLLVAVTLAISTRRLNALLLNNAGLERERANLSRYFSPNVVEELSQNDEPLKQIRNQDIGVLFIDIVGFTRMSDGRDPYEVIELLRGFHGRMEREVFRHSGTLDKYLGDGLMATFGTPTAGEQDASNALACARSMMQVMERWNTERKRQGEAEIQVGIGIHYGEALLGDIGANRLEFAVIGTAVNVASRLEALTRQHNSRLVISDTLREQVIREGGGSDLLEGLSKRNDQDIRGIEDKMTVWTL